MLGAADGIGLVTTGWMEGLPPSFLKASKIPCFCRSWLSSRTAFYSMEEEGYGWGSALGATRA